jgi:hypothetical protein
MEQTAKILSVKMVLVGPDRAKAKEPCQGTPVLMGPPVEHASIVTKAMRLRAELSIWKGAGFPMAARSVRKARLAVCKTCTYWSPRGNFGLGECGYPGCGCTRAKAALGTSKCPAGKWPA